MCIPRGGSFVDDNEFVAFKIINQSCGGIYGKRGSANYQNIRIMDEHQSILALGAGGISKRYYPAENRLERVPNVSNYEIYIERLDEMIERKRLNFFEEV